MTYPDKKTLTRIAIKELRKEPKAQGRDETVRNITNQTGITWEEANTLAREVEQNQLRMANVARAPVFLVMGLVGLLIGFYLTATNLQTLQNFGISIQLWDSIRGMMDRVYPLSHTGTDTIQFVIGALLLLGGISFVLKGIGGFFK